MVQYVGKDLVAGVSLAQAGGKAALYGATPVAQRASSLQASSFISVSSNATVGATLAAWMTEVTQTLTGLGAWKGSA